jgi:hypothetical protein
MALSLTLENIRFTIITEILNISTFFKDRRALPAESIVNVGAVLLHAQSYVKLGRWHPALAPVSIARFEHLFLSTPYILTQTFLLTTLTPFTFSRSSNSLAARLVNGA